MSQAQFTVTVEPAYLPDHSDPLQKVYAFSYTITIQNTGQVTAQLIARHWTIEHANGETEEVHGLGVVGHQPVLKPGEAFEYTSWTRLRTPQGAMLGHFDCMTEEARPFQALIPRFELDVARSPAAEPADPGSRVLH